MSLWDLYDEKDIHALISDTKSPDFDSILGHSELFQLFRENDQDLINFFNNPEIFQKIIHIMIKNKDTKITKRIVELFLFKDSILLKKLFLADDLKIAESLIQCIDKTNEATNDDTISLLKEDRLVRIGYISRIFMHALKIAEYKERILSLFSSSPKTLATLSKHADITSLYDLLLSYLNLLKPEEQWILFAYLQILLPKGKSASCPKCFIQYKDLIIIIIKEMTTVSPLHNQLKSNLLCLITNSFKNSIEIEKNAKTDVINSISTNLCFIFNNPETSDEIKVLILQFAMIIPPERSLFNIAASLIKNSNPNQFNSVDIAALDLLSVSPSKTLSILLPTIIKTFVADKTNSFHHLSFLNFIKNAITKVPEMRGPIAKEILPLIFSESSGTEKWRKNAQRVGIFLEIADSIDQYVDELASSGTVDKSTFASWKTFRNSDLKKWKLKDSEKVDAPEAVAMSSAEKKGRSLAAAAAAEEEAALAKAKTQNAGNSSEKEKTKQTSENSNITADAAGKTTTESGNNGFGFGDGFPPADSFPKEEKEEQKDKGFGGFEASFPSADSFPKEDKKEEKDSGFGGFEASFPSADSFPKEEKKDENNSGFGGFGFGDGFPPADSFPKEEKEEQKDKGFGGFEASFPSADSFPKEEKKEEKDSGFGGFEASFPSADSFPKEEKEDEKNKGFGGFEASFPSADSFPKEEKKDEGKDKGFGGFGFGDGFPPADSFPKEEKEDEKDKGFGGFDNAFPSADSFPKEEKDDDKNNGFGGFGNAFPSADAFPKDEKKDENSNGGFGGFQTVEKSTSKSDEEKEETDKQKPKEPAFKTSVSDKKEDEDKKEPEDEEEDDDDDSDFEDLSAQQSQTQQSKLELNKPAPMPVFTQSKPVSDEPVDVSFNHFLELIDNPCWTYTGPTPAELFGQKDAFSTAEEAFNFLVGKSTK